MASDGASSDTHSQRVAWVDQATRWLETSSEVDRFSPAVAALAQPFNRPPLVDGLRGTWLGHALHPLLTDVPLGCWIAAVLLDMMPGKQKASRDLVAAGLVAVPLTAGAGFAEWGTMDRPAEKRVATVHALGNVVAALAFLRSWLARRQGRQSTGVMWSLMGGALAVVTGYLGGHMAFAQRVGTGERGKASRPARSRPGVARTPATS